MKKHQFNFELVSVVINFVDHFLSQGAPTGHESAETPVGNESNGAVAGEGANFIVKLFQDCGGKLVKIETPHNKELEVILNIMETTPEDQHSHHDHQDNPNEFRSMRDRMHPPRMSAPSCIVPPTEQLDKAKIWLNSLRPRSIRTWTDLQAKFLKKFFPTHRTNSLKRQISNFSTKENEKFYECWERHMEAINAFPHHSFDTWLLNPEEAMDFLSYVAEVSRGWDEPHRGEVGKMNYDKKRGEARTEKNDEVQVVAETQVQVKPCLICQSYEHLVEECPTIPVAREMFGEQANVIGQFKPNSNASYGNTYNSSWRNHPNFSWKPRAPQYQQPAQPSQPSQQASSLEQAIVNLSKVVGDFVGEQKSINSQLSQRIDNVENTLNKMMDGMQNDLSQKIDNLQYSISRLTNLNTVQEKGRFPSQPHQNPKGIHEVETQEGEASQVRDVKALITLRSGKKVESPTPKLYEEEKEEEEIKKMEEMKGKKKDISEGKKDRDSTVMQIQRKSLLRKN
ncbi:hypothetical protein CK203_115841 [Vitis vinifera]|uniref:Retrotransposon gag domain-containing protein n=1 Tax=Vitis vinifera TaxID=29760 RepID=A0A438CSC4_VITVI|nr:hypothetical protein CK203_115841 [Vitis vinifera]